ncbi:MAG: hypothetical protein ACRDPC_14935 [Solirubrobacteraceae bacterium]
MTAAVGLDRLPRPVALLLGEAAGNLLAVSNRLDELLAGDRAALEAIVRGEGEGDRIVHDLVAVVGASRRDGPRRGPLIELGQAIDDVLDALEDVACSWHARPVDEVAVLLLALRDGVREAAHAVASLEQPDQLGTWLARGRDRDDEIRRLNRAGRAWLLVEQPDTELAIRGHDLLERAEALERACIRLRARLHAMTLSSSGL